MRKEWREGGRKRKRGREGRKEGRPHLAWLEPRAHGRIGAFGKHENLPVLHRLDYDAHPLAGGGELENLEDAKKEGRAGGREGNGERLFTLSDHPETWVRQRGRTREREREGGEGGGRG